MESVSLELVIITLVFAFAIGVATTKYLFASKEKKATRKLSKFVPFSDKYSTIDQVQKALRKAGLESSNLIIGIDYTKSNEWTGARTYGNRNLHDTRSMNPYQQAISIIGRTLEEFDDDKLIPCFGFGDSRTLDKRVFPFYDHRPCQGFNEVLKRYNEITPKITLAGPTSFAPLIYEAIAIVEETKAYHILLIVADGQVSFPQTTMSAIEAAANHPLSIIMVGVGDGPWDMMHEFDDRLPARKFDNFQFVPFHEVMTSHQHNEAAFALTALMEIPEQYRAICDLGYLS